jgi:excisionase family DNA binding protein
MKLVVLNKKDTEILTSKEAGAYLKLNTRTLYTLAKQGNIPAMRVGRGWRFSRAALESYVRGQRRS